MENQQLSLKDEGVCQAPEQPDETHGKGSQLLTVNLHGCMGRGRVGGQEASAELEPKSQLPRVEILLPYHDITPAIPTPLAHFRNYLALGA